MYTHKHMHTHLHTHAHTPKHMRACMLSFASIHSHVRRCARTCTQPGLGHASICPDRRACSTKILLHLGVNYENSGWGHYGGPVGPWLLPQATGYHPNAFLTCTFTFKCQGTGEGEGSYQDHWAERQVAPAQGQLVLPASGSMYCTIIQIVGSQSEQQMKQSCSLSWKRW